MRRPLVAGILAGSLVIAACSDQPTAPNERGTPAEAVPAPAFVSSAICSVPTANCIQSLINALFRSGDQLKTANTHWSNIQTKVRQKRFGEAQARATDLVTFGLKSFYAGKLLGGMSQPTPDNLAAMTTAVYQFSGLTTTQAPVIPAEALSPDGAAAIITPQSPTTLVITPTKQGGVLVPAGAAPILTVVSIARLPDSPGPLLTSLDQFPLFYEFTSSPEVTFDTDVTTGVCQSQDFSSPDETLPAYEDLRIAHNVGTNFGDVEILPRMNAPFLDCTNTTEFGTLKLGGLTGFAAIGWNFVGRTVGPLAKAVFLPDELHAAVLGSCCLGGSTRKFSPHGAVDPGSNPGSINFNPDAATYSELSAPVGTAVTPAPSVVVKSNNGAPIANVPVTFAVGEEGGTVNGGTTATVTTNAGGIATVTAWTLGTTAGTYTLTATPPAFAQIGTTEPYKPAVAFSTGSEATSLQFTATATAGPATTIAIQAGDNQSAPAGEAVAIPPAVRVTDQYGNVVSGFTVTFSVGSGGGSITGGTAVTDAGGVATVGSWTIGPGTNTLLATAAGLNGSPVTFTATAASSASGSDLVVFNDINIFLNSGNDQLFKNLVGFTGTGSRASGKSVLEHRGHNSGCPSEWCASQTAFQTTLTNQGYTILVGDDATAPLTSIDPDVKLIVLVLPRQTYSNAEINSLKAFAGAGGRIIFVGEFATYFGFGAQGVATENDFLAKMGSDMENIGGEVDCLTYWSLTSLRPHQITAGLTGVLLACSSILQPGPGDYALFYDTTGELVLGAVARLDLTPLPPDGGTLTAVQGIRVAPLGAQSERLSVDPMGRGIVAKIPGVQR